MYRLAIIITTFNRKEITLRCLRQILSQNLPEKLEFNIFLVDDNSADGTPEMITLYFPQVNLIKGDGNLFWNRGMHRGLSVAIKKDYDFYLWLNDDTILSSDAIEKLIKLYHELVVQKMKDDIIILSATIDPVSNQISYGGLRILSRINKLKLKRLTPGNLPQLCDTFEGNCVLLPRCVIRKVGNIDPYFHHKMGDTDYGLRATKSGVELYLAPFIVAECIENKNQIFGINRPLSFKERVKLINHPKGLPFKEWYYLNIKHNGILGILLATLTYIKIMFMKRK